MNPVNLTFRKNKIFPTFRRTADVGKNSFVLFNKVLLTL